MIKIGIALEWAALVTVVDGMRCLERAHSELGATDIVASLNETAPGMAQLVYRTRTHTGDWTAAGQAANARAAGAAAPIVIAFDDVPDATAAAELAELAHLDFDPDIDAIGADVEPVDALQHDDVEWGVRYEWPGGYYEDHPADTRLDADDDVAAHNRDHVDGAHTSRARTVFRPVAYGQWRTAVDDVAVEA